MFVKFLNKYSIILFFFTSATLLYIYQVVPILKNNNEQVIKSDGIGYFAYLPAIIIYQDLNLDFFSNDKLSKYNLPSKEIFGYQNKNKFVNKYFVGEALLISPFFLIAHFLSYILEIPADGFSFPYQISVLLAALFYTTFSFFLLKKYFPF